jgi:hypothetical protein
MGFDNFDSIGIVIPPRSTGTTPRVNGMERK